jgi:hypothetical protein
MISPTSALILFLFDEPSQWIPEIGLLFLLVEEFQMDITDAWLMSEVRL